VSQFDPYQLIARRLSKGCLAALLIVTTLQPPLIAKPTGTVYGKYSAEFPEDKTQLWSPNGQYLVKSINSTSVHPHFLFLVKKGQSKRIPLKLDCDFGYEHFVEVLWAPDSSRFIVNQWDPDYTNAFIFSVNDPSHPVNVDKTLRSLIKNEQEKRVFTGQHATGLLIYVTRWVNSKSVQVRISGDFALNYLWDLKDSLKLIKSDHQP